MKEGADISLRASPQCQEEQGELSSYRKRAGGGVSTHSFSFRTSTPPSDLIGIRRKPGVNVMQSFEKKEDTSEIPRDSKH